MEKRAAVCLRRHYSVSSKDPTGQLQHSDFIVSVYWWPASEGWQGCNRRIVLHRRQAQPREVGAGPLKGLLHEELGRLGLHHLGRLVDLG